MSDYRYATDRIYTFAGPNDEWFTFHSPDGRGRIFHTNIAEAKEQTGLRSVVHLMGETLE